MIRDKDAAEGRGKGKRRRKVSYLTINKIDKVDYKEVNILRRFLNDRGKIVPARQSGNTAKQQRMITRAIDQARELALIPFVAKDSSDRREGSYRRSDRDRHHSSERANNDANVEAAATEAAAPAATE